MFSNREKNNIKIEEDKHEIRVSPNTQPSHETNLLKRLGKKLHNNTNPRDVYVEQSGSMKDNLALNFAGMNALFKEQERSKKVNTRRRFIRLTTVGAAGAIFGGPVLSNIGKNTLYKSNYTEAIQNASLILKEKYNVSFRLNDLSDEFKKSKVYKEGDLVSLYEEMQKVDNAFSVYPQAAIKELNLKISLVGSLNDNRFILKDIVSNVNGVASMKTKQDIALRSPGAIEKNIVINELGKVFSSSETKTIHHELFHIIDALKIDDSNNAWENLNREAYSGDGMLNYLNPIRSQGYAKNYGRTNIFEDRSTVAEFIMTDLEKLEEYAKEDIVLAKKIEFIKNVYLIWSKGKMNNDYWKALKEYQKNLK